MLDISLISAVIGGILTFFAPCTLPLIPAYIAFIGGNSEEIKFSRYRLLMNASFFVLGFSVVFILFGLASGTLGKYLVIHRMLITQIGGGFIFLFGLSMLGVLPKFPSFSSGQVPVFITPRSPFGGFVLGILFALGWSPCLGPILGSILILAGTSGTVLSGALLLATYSLGLAIPFLIVALLYGSAFTYVAKLQKYLPIISRVGAVLIIILGILLVFGQFGILLRITPDVFRVTGFDSLMDLM